MEQYLQGVKTCQSICPQDFQFFPNQLKVLLTHLKFLHLHFNDNFKHCIYFGGFSRILTVATLDHSISCGNTNNSLNTSVVNCVGHQELEDQLMPEEA